MSKPVESEDDDSFICYNCLISISHISNEENDNLKSSKYIMRKDNFSNFLVLRQNNISKYEYLNIPDSYFYIRDIEECVSIYGNNSKDNEDSIFSKESHFTKKNRLNQSTRFILQHMISGKFVSCIMNIKNNKITLKLVNDVESSYPFTLEIINKKRNLIGTMKFDQYFYLNAFVQEDNMSYYLDEEILENKNEKGDLSIFEQIQSDTSVNNYKINSNPDYSGIVLNRKPSYELFLINQTYIMKESNNIYSGHLINIIFTKKKDDKEEKMMLCLREKTDYRHSTKNSIMKRSKYFEIRKSNYEVSMCDYTDKLYEQVINNALWVIEDNLFFYKGALNVKPINIKETFRLRNALTGFYLDIKQSGLKFGSHQFASNIQNKDDKKEYEFDLVDEQQLEAHYFFQFNFKFLNHIISDESKYVVNDGKYILKGIFQNIKKQAVFEEEVEKNQFSYIDAEKYYLPVSIDFSDNIDKKDNIKNTTMKNFLSLSQVNPKIIKNFQNMNNIIVKYENDNDFIFTVNKIDVLKGSQVIFIQKVILLMKQDFNQKNINLNILNERLVFLKEYLINIDYSFRDKTKERNVPIKERQKLLWKFNIVSIISSFIDFLTKNKEKYNLSAKNLGTLLESIKSLFIYLSQGEEAIKISIYV